MKHILAILAVIAAVSGKPLPAPQGVTAKISPSAPAPSGCMPSMSGSFGVAVQNITGGGQMGASQTKDGQPQVSGKVTQISDGQIQATTKAPVNQITDGQIQASTKAPVSQIGDGQIQGPKTTMMPVTQIGDGQVQGPKKTMAPVTQIGDGQVQGPKATPVSQISDGQVQGPKATPVSQISDGQVQATPKPAVSQISDGQIQATGKATPVSQINDGQPQASGVSQIGDGQPQASGMPASMMSMVACKSDGTLTLTLADGVLKDSKGRTGYIAANYQFQFDAPPQTGAIYTSGWSVCGNGSLALGGSTTFYQCLSGDFYNLYNENWAPQCNGVTIDVLSLVSC